MHTSLLLLMLTVTVESATAQTPAPTPPRPAPAPAPAPQKPAARPHPPATPLLPPVDQWELMAEPHFSLAPLALADQMHFELAVPSTPYEYKFEFPQEPLFGAPSALDWEFPHEPLLAPLPPYNAFWPNEGQESSPHGNLSRLRPEQGSPEDSLFRAAREALNRGEYTRASTLFQSFGQKYPRSRAAPAAMYWQAFALYRSGSSEELRTALEALKAQQERYPEAGADPDAATLRTRLYAALAARGDAQAAAALRTATASGQSCDREDMEVRAEALNALAQLDAPEARPTLKRVLARRDECSATLRRRAVYILGRSGTEEAAADLLEAAKNDPDPGVRSDAIMLIARSPGASTVKTLEQLFNESTDERTRQAALSALRAKGGPEAKRALRNYIEKADLTDRTRAEAIQQLASLANGGESWSVGVPGGTLTTTRRPDPEGGQEDAVFLRGLYAKSDSRIVKSAILSAVARIGGSASEQWLLSVAKNKDEDTSLRREALSRIKTSALSIEELGKLFDALPERELRYAVVNQLASRDEPAAVDKLIEIAKSGTDPQVRRQAIAALAQKKDPRTMKLLLELVEKP